MTSPRAKYEFRAAPVLDLANRMYNITSRASGILLLVKVNDRAHYHFHNETLERYWETIQAVRLVTCYYVGMAGQLRTYGAPLMPETLDKVESVRDSMRKPLRDKALTRDMERHYQDGQAWAQEFYAAQRGSKA